MASEAGMLVKRKGMITTTKKHLSLLDDTRSGSLFGHLFNAYYRKYNIGYQSNFSIDLDWMQHEIGFILYPLSLKAKNWIDVAVLHKELLHPMVLADLSRQVASIQYCDEVATMVRYFVRPLHEWGLLEVEWTQEARFPKPKRIRLSPLFDSFIHFNENAG